MVILKIIVKYSALLIFITLLNSLKAKDYNIEMYFTNEFKEISFPDENKFFHVSGTGVWKDSFGDYGNLGCFGRIVSDKKIGSSLDIFCEGENQDKEKFWIRLNRNSEDIDTGIGYTTYLYGSGKYSKFVDLKCRYASKIFGKNAILTQKCKI